MPVHIRFWIHMLTMTASTLISYRKANPWVGGGGCNCILTDKTPASLYTSLYGIKLQWSPYIFQHILQKPAFVADFIVLLSQGELQTNIHSLNLPLSHRLRMQVWLSHRLLILVLRQLSRIITNDLTAQYIAFCRNPFRFEQSRTIPFNPGLNLPFALFILQSALPTHSFI